MKVLRFRVPAGKKVGGNVKLLARLLDLDFLQRPVQYQELQLASLRRQIGNGKGDVFVRIPTTHSALRLPLLVELTNKPKPEISRSMAMCTDVELMFSR